MPTLPILTGRTRNVTTHRRPHAFGVADSPPSSVLEHGSGAKLPAGRSTVSEDPCRASGPGPRPSSRLWMADQPRLLPFHDDRGRLASRATAERVPLAARCSPAARHRDGRSHRLRQHPRVFDEMRCGPEALAPAGLCPVRPASNQLHEGLSPCSSRRSSASLNDICPEFQFPGTAGK